MSVSEAYQEIFLNRWYPKKKIRLRRFKYSFGFSAGMLFLILQILVIGMFILNSCSSMLVTTLLKISCNVYVHPDWF